MASPSKLISSTKVYRFLPFHRAVQFLKTGYLAFARPSSWEDPYEKDYDHMGGRDVYAQCWTLAFHSDALWRIYSPDLLGVRIRTNYGKICNELLHFNDKYSVHAESKQVKYCKHNILRKEQENAETTQKVFIKRDAFDHEKEVRIVLAVGKTNRHVEIKNNCCFLKIKSKPTDFIDLVMIDPRAPEELVDALKSYFRTEFDGKIHCIKSSLYRYDKDDRI